MTRKIINVLITIVLGIIIFYFFLPAINIQSIGFWIYLLILVWFYHVVDNYKKIKIIRGNIQIGDSGKKTTRLLIVTMIVWGSIILINLINAPLFRANKYATRITIDNTTSFTDDVKQVDFKALPLLDKNSSQKLGDRVMGQMPELVSQFDVSNLYTQINYNQEIVRVTPLEYASGIKFLTNYKSGVMGYIIVNSVTGEATLKKLEDGMKYMPSAMFFKNLDRHLRFKYPFMLFDTESFEIDNDGNPYWIVPTIKYAGLELRKEISGVIIVNAISGATNFYKAGEIPTWVDHVYSADLIIEQVNDWGLYSGGFFNSVFSQKNVVATTEGYNYTVMNDDVYLYTGITSTSKDESNIGFILTNMRTKQTHFYAVPGAEEYSAMASAEGQVQQMNYHASFPLLINLNNRPTYLISLKDNAGLVKMYAFVDVVDYQKVVVTDAAKGIETAAYNYLGTNVIDNNALKTKEIIIKSIKNVIIDGNTYFYITDSENNKYKASIKVAPNKLPFIEKDELLKISYKEIETINEIFKLE